MHKNDDSLSLDEILRRMPKRKMQRTTIDVAEDQIKVVDTCAKALGLNRSNFLLLWFDSSSRAMIEWTENLVNRSQVSVNFPTEEKKIERK